MNSRQIEPQSAIAILYNISSGWKIKTVNNNQKIGCNRNEQQSNKI